MKIPANQFKSASLVLGNSAQCSTCCTLQQSSQKSVGNENGHEPSLPPEALKLFFSSYHLLESSISQAHRTKGVRLAAIADISLDRAISSLQRTDFPSSKYDTNHSLADGFKQDKPVVTSDSAAMIATPEIDVILEITGNPAVGVRHALLYCEHKKHIVMINVEADVLAVPLLARKAKEAGIIYSMAYGVW